MSKSNSRDPKSQDQMPEDEAYFVPETVEEKKPYTINPCGEVVSKEGMARHLTELLAVSRKPGEQRAQFIRLIESNAEKELAALTVRYGDACVSINTRGEVVLNGKSDAPAKNPPGVHPHFSSGLRGAAPANKKIGDVTIPCGVCLIVAGGGAGKSPLAHALASHGVTNYSVVRAGEPLSGYSSSSESIAFSLAKAVLDSSDVVLDSIKDLLSGGGSAMKSGLSRDALISISGWAALAAEAGCTIYVPVNPSTPDKDVLELLVEAAKSNATMAISAMSPERWAFSARQGESLQRVQGSLNMRFLSNGTASVNFEASVSESSDASHVTRHITTILSYEALNAAQRRSMAQQNV